ncbi:MAG: alcohol dehydrogenase catalytic domain-containing protein [Propionibacteriaceae bacterium]
MKALVLQDFGVLTVAERSAPEPGPGEVVIALIAAGICGTDIHGYTGENGRRQPGQVMGHECVGRVAAVGPDTDAPAIGTVVTFNPVVLPAGSRASYAGREQHSPDKYVIGVRADVSAGWAEQVVVPVENVVVLPAEMPVVHGALVEPFAVAVHAVRRVAAGSADRVLVIGGGPIGQSVVLALRRAGVGSIAVSEVSAPRRELLRRLGAIPIDAQSPTCRDDVLAALDGPATVTIDAVGIDATMALALSATVIGGTIGLVGMGSKQLSLDAFSISTAERSVVGCFTYSDDDFRAAADWIGRSAELADLLISRQITPNEADSTVASLAAGDDTAGRVIIRLDRFTDHT